MKLNVLVVAAIVITSVNAGLLDEVMGCVGLGCGSGSGSSEDEPGKPQDPKPEANPICDDINAKLPLLWDKVYALNREFWKEMPSFNRMMMMKKDAKGMNEKSEKNEKGKKSKKAKKDEKGKEVEEVEKAEEVEEFEEVDLRAEMIREWLKWNPVFIPDLRNFKAKYDGLRKDYDEVLERLNKNGCSTRYFDLASLEEIAKRGDLPDWYDEK
ncbi:hypothetical protein BASA62_002092, partial [Batrachochytrium salamandrivorans]